MLQNLRIWEFLTASLEERSSFQNREFENFASLESRICEDLVYLFSTNFSRLFTLVTDHAKNQVKVSEEVAAQLS